MQQPFTWRDSWTLQTKAIIRSCKKTYKCIWIPSPTYQSCYVNRYINSVLMRFDILTKSNDNTCGCVRISDNILTVFLCFYPIYRCSSTQQITPYHFGGTRNCLGRNSDSIVNISSYTDNVISISHKKWHKYRTSWTYQRYLVQLSAII